MNQHAANRCVAVTVIDAIRLGHVRIDAQPAEERKFCWRHRWRVTLRHACATDCGCVAEKKAILLTRETGVSAGQIGTVCVLTLQGIFKKFTDDVSSDLCTVSCQT